MVSHRHTHNVSVGKFETQTAPILFYTNIQRTFRSTLVGYLYQICQHRQVVLLSEKLDNETEVILSDRSLFPGLIGRVHVGQYDKTNGGLVGHYRRLDCLAREIVESWLPSIVFAPGVNFFEHSLRRQAKESCGALCIDEIGMLNVCELSQIPLLLELHGANARFPSWMPRPIRLFLSRARRMLAHFVYYILGPIMAGSRFFPGVNGISRLDYTRLRGMDFALVFTRNNQTMLFRGGADRNKLLVIPHPMKPGAADAVWEAYGIGLEAWSGESRLCPRILTCFLDIECNWGFRRADLSHIPDNEVFDSRVRVIRALLSALPDWKIRIKPHPMSGVCPLYEHVRGTIMGLSDRIEWIPPQDPAEHHIKTSSAVVGFPPASTAIYTAIMLCPGIPTMVVDINRELRGDAYRGMDGVVTVDTWSDLEARLDQLHAGSWPADVYRHDPGDYGTLEDFMSALLTERGQQIMSFGGSGKL